MAAWVPSHDLPRLAAALGPSVNVGRCDCLDALAAVVRGGVAGAVARPAYVPAPDVTGLATLVTQFPTTVFAGFTTPAWPPHGEPALLTVLAASCAVGQGGGRTFPPFAGADGWELLARSLASARPADPVQRACVAAVLGEVWGTHRTDVLGVRQPSTGGSAKGKLFEFFAAVFGPGAETVGDVAARLGVDAAALAGWFTRHRLPGADRYVAAARLVRAAWADPPAVAPAVAVVSEWHAHLEAPGSIYRAARRLRRMATLGAARPAGVCSTPGVGTRMLNRYHAALVGPCRDALRTFNPAGDRSA